MAMQTIKTQTIKKQNSKKRNELFNNTYLRTFGLSIIASSILVGCGGGGGGSDSGPNPSPQPSNSPPVLSAESFRVVSANDAVTLTASATDSDGDTINFNWTQLSGNSVANTSGFNTNSASFSAPENVESLTFEVTATANGQSDREIVRVLIVEDVDDAIFVDADFTGSPQGTLEAPYIDLEEALTGLQSNQDVYIKTPSNDQSYSLWQTRNSTFVLSGGNSVYGGFSTDWSRNTATNLTPINARDFGIIYSDVDAKTVVSGVALSITSEDAISTLNIAPGIYASTGSSELVIDSNVINVSDYADIGASSSEGNVFGIYAINVDTTRISNNQIVTGNALSAENASSRTTGTGADGADGEDARVGLNINGGDGGSGAGGWNGGDGGDAGNNSFEAGEKGERGNGRDTTPIVDGGSPGTEGISTGGVGGNGGNGGNGEHGARGTSGAGARGIGSFTASFGAFSRPQGTDGGTGYSGGGGGGGGGGAGGAAGANGGAGGGGGEGGLGGAGGFPARSGAASIAVHVTGGTFHQIFDNELTSGNGGAGGRGGLGATGGVGGEGGDGVLGTQGPVNAKGGRGGNGGNGGDGGRGGAGGAGGGGPSFGVFIGSDTAAEVKGNTITTGNGGLGGPSRYSSSPNNAGEGGWSVGIFDADLTDGSTPTASDNVFTLGQPGENGVSRDGTGQAINSNF